MDIKQCFNCFKLKSMDEFFNNKYCKLFITEVRDKYKFEEKICTQCNTSKHVDKFYENNNYVDGMLPTCKDCIKNCKYIKKQLKEFDESVYIKFIEEHIQTSLDSSDYFTPTYIFPLFKKYCRDKCKYPHNQFKFKEDMSSHHLLGPLTSTYWVRIKYVDKK